MPNPNLTSAQVVPGFYGYVDYNAQGSGTAPNNRTLLWGYTGASAQRTPNQPFLPGSQQEADDGCERGSDLARAYAAAVSQPEAQGAEIWLMPIVPPSGGVAAQYKFRVILSATNPSKPGTISGALCSQPVPAVGFTTADTASSIATALAAAIATMSDLPIATCTAAGSVITIVYKHKGLTGEDFPVRFNVSPAATGVGVCAATAGFTTAASGAGSMVVALGALSVSTAVADADTAVAIAANVAISFNADSYPLYAKVATGVAWQASTVYAVGQRVTNSAKFYECTAAGTSAGSGGPTTTSSAITDGTVTWAYVANATAGIAAVDLFFANDKDVRRVSGAVLTSTGTTVNLGSGATDGTGSPSSLSNNGTLGTGTPSLSSAISNLATHQPFRSWMNPWVETGSIGTLATNIELSSNGSLTGQKQQILTMCSPLAASTAGALLTGSSPDLTATAPHYGLLWSPDAAVQGHELAARVAAARAGKFIDTPQFNWNGFKVQGNSRAPILLPWSRPSVDAQNTALRTYALAPVIRGASGFMEVVKGRSTSLAADKRLWAWSSEAQAAFHAIDLGQRYDAAFRGGSLLRYSEPKAAGIFDKTSFESETRKAMRAWELAGHYDGADLLAPYVKATPDLNNPFRMNTEYPESPVLDLDQVVITSRTSSPSA
jgi:phage tail sheath gpL-like